MNNEPLLAETLDELLHSPEYRILRLELALQDVVTLLNKMVIGVRQPELYDDLREIRRLLEMAQ